DAHLSFTVPGAVDAYFTVLESFGTRSLGEVLAPALHYAEHGFPMYEYMGKLLAIPESRSQFDLYPPGGTDVFYPGGRAPRVGELFVQPALAGTLRRLVEADARGRGHRTAGIAAARERFYRGDIAAAIGGFSERVGGLLRAGDLAGDRASFEPPARVTFAGRDILGQAAWSQGPVLLQALGMLETLDLRAMGHNSTPYIHAVAEALKLAFADRERYYGDANEGGVSLRELLAPAYLRERAKLIRMDRAAPEQPAAGDPWRGGAAAGGAAARRGERRRGRRRHHPHRGHRSRRQHDLPHPERRRLPQIRLRAGARLHPQHAQRDVRAREGASERAHPRPTPAHHAGELSHLRGWRADHDHWLPGRRRPGPG